VIDDVQLRSVAMLTEFMSVDPGWRLAVRGEQRHLSRNCEIWNSISLD
jgi:hypothetical protein